MEYKYRRCWTLKGVGISLNTPKRIVEEGKELSLSKLSPNSGVGIASGEFELVKKTGSKIISCGKLLPGDAVGVMQGGARIPAETVLFPLMKSEIIALTWDMAMEKVKQLPPLKFRIRGVLKKGEIELRREEYFVQAPEKRIARLFFLLSDYNPDRPLKGAVEVPLELEVLANLLSLTEVETALVTGLLVSEGAIEISRKSFKISSLDKLNKIRGSK